MRTKAAGPSSVRVSKCHQLLLYGEARIAMSRGLCTFIELWRCGHCYGDVDGIPWLPGL